MTDSDDKIANYRASSTDELSILYETVYSSGNQNDLTSTVIYSVAIAAGKDPCEFSRPPIYEKINLEAVESLFFPNTGKDKDHCFDGIICFEYEGYRIEITVEGEVCVYG